MDLLNTVRKQGTRGGRAEFKWEDVKNSQHRENYLGHSVMAPVGRWQSGRDLSWYSKSAEDRQRTEAEIIAEEKRLIKEQERDMIRQKFGDSAVSSEFPTNPNLTSLGRRSSVGPAQAEDKTGEDRSRDRKRHRHHRSRRSRSHSRDRSRERRRHRDRDDNERYRSSRHERRYEESRSRSRSPRRRRHDDRRFATRRRSHDEGALPRRHKDSRDDMGTFDKYRRERDDNDRRYGRKSPDDFRKDPHRADHQGNRYSSKSNDARRRSRSPD